MSELSLWDDMPQENTKPIKQEKTRKSCKYSEVQVPLTSRQLRECEHVECPECKSIRTVTSSGFTGEDYFPWHKPPTRIRVTDQYWRQVDGIWTITTKEQVSK